MWLVKPSNVSAVVVDSVILHGVLSNVIKNSRLSASTFSPPKTLSFYVLMFLIVQGVPPLGLTVTKTVQIIVEAINDGPQITAPLDVAAAEDTPTAVAGITIQDSDCDDAPRGVLEVVIAASQGRVQLLGTVAGLYLMEATPGTVKIRGKTAPVNAALSGLSYIGAEEFDGEDTIVVTADDLGNSGTGGRLRATASIRVTVSAVNDPPKISAPPELDLPAGGVLFAAEDQLMPLGTFGISDPDDGFLRVTVSAKVGSVSTDGVDGPSLLMASRDDEGQPGEGSSLTFEGTSEGLSSVLAELMYTSSPDWNSVANGRDLVSVSRTSR